MNHRSYGLQAVSIGRCVLDKHSVSVEVLATITISIQRLLALYLCRGSCHDLEAHHTN